MGRFIMAIGLLALFVGWILFRSLVKRDLMQHKNTLLLGTSFLATWGLMYWLIWA